MKIIHILLFTVLNLKCLYFSKPKVLMMHFVQGLPDAAFKSSQMFEVDGAVYYMTGLVQYRNKPDHFVAWIHDPLCKYKT